MATTYTDNFHLGKQENRPDKFDMSVVTRNMEIIDAAMQEILDTIAEIDSKKVSKVEGNIHKLVRQFKIMWFSAFAFEFFQIKMCRKFCCVRVFVIPDHI